MKGILRLRSVLFLLPLMVFFCQKTNDPWGFCVGNNDGFQTAVPHGSPFNFALGKTCPEDFPYPDEPVLP